MATERQKFIWAVGQVESGGNYKARNSGSGALGRWQVMPSNVGPWTKKALGKAMTPTEFYNSPAAQDKVADVILGGYYDKYGWMGAASAWFSGSPVISNKSDGSNTVPQYISKVRAWMANPNAGSAGSASGSGVEQANALNPLDWADAASSFFKLMTDPITWLRVAMVLGGGISLAIGLFMMSGQAERLGKAAKMATDFVPGGKAIKAATAVKAAA
jgi:hypothetical protein